MWPRVARDLGPSVFFNAHSSINIQASACHLRVELFEQCLLVDAERLDLAACTSTHHDSQPGKSAHTDQDHKLPRSTMLDTTPHYTTTHHTTRRTARTQRTWTTTAATHWDCGFRN
eukprot:TRINITY_DN868_c1_g2_i1.p2 TRINITY_DN868_c1_g2~~TRINITY_DN868_c1_g2_i1.p2  ORF type:complete len:116 (-),score=5.87 TRINITY_DN868_c1_g2_i1:24-371(-)